MEITGTKLHSFFNLFWNLIKKHYQTDLIHGSQEEVEMFQSDIEAVKKQYLNDKKLQVFACTCLIAFMRYLEGAETMPEFVKED